jgi:glutamyl/glutaminyl-tRNA synthetase
MLRSRIAPTPSGYLHIGNAFNFILTWLWVRKEGGSLHLRIDDLDAPRIKPEYVDDIFYTLNWLGLDWDKGPQTVAEQEKQFSQKHRVGVYTSLINKLMHNGNTFACSCSRKELATYSQYPGTCRLKGLPLNNPDCSLRIVTPQNNPIRFKDYVDGEVTVNLYNEMRDFIIRRRDGIPAYQIASLIDDIDFKINLIVRGRDLITSTAAQLYLAELAGDEVFRKATFYHHPLLMDEIGEKLSKSAGSDSIKTWRGKSENPEQLYQLFSKMLGWTDLASTAAEMLAFTKQGQPFITKQPLNVL